MGGTFETHVYEIFTSTSVTNRLLTSKGEDGGKNMTYVRRVD
jgi:hypothetical protein